MMTEEANPGEEGRDDELDSLQAVIDAMQEELAKLRAGNAALEAQAAAAEGMVEALREPDPPTGEPEPPGGEPPVKPPLPPGSIFVDPRTGLPWYDGFGQAAKQMKQLEKMRGFPLGAAAAWTDYSKVAIGWEGLRGGPLDKPEILKGVFSREGAYNFHDSVRQLDRKALLIWIFPALPGELDNEYVTEVKAKKSKGKFKVGWKNPSVYRRLTDPKQDRFVTIRNWTDYGARLGFYIGLHGINPALFVLPLGWERSGNWYPWSNGPDIQSANLYWRIAVDSIRAGLRRTLPGGWEKVRFEDRYAGVTKFVDWDPLEHPVGNAHAGLIGCSIHGGLDSLGDPLGWHQEVHGGAMDKIGLDPVRQLAELQGVPWGADEWGIVSRDGDLHHPKDPNPRRGMQHVLNYFAQHARTLHHACFLYSSKYQILDRNWPGQAGYVENMHAIRKRLRQPQPAGG